MLTPDVILQAYTQGLFPMARTAQDEDVQWVRPALRGQLSIPALHIPRSLQKIVRNTPLRIEIDTAFPEVILACAEERPDRPETWINPAIQDVFTALFHRGYAHCVACRNTDGLLVGGLYGLAIGGAFFGESMFSRTPNASKIALVHLVARLWKGGFRLLDTQFVNDHLTQFGVYELPHKTYMIHLQDALSHKADFRLEGLDQGAVLQAYLAFRKTQNT